MVVLESEDVVSGPGVPIADLYALAECDLIMGPPSTFSGWASFYGEVPLLKIEDPSAPVSPGSFRLDDYSPA